MKKILSLLVCALFATTLFAQSPFVYSPFTADGQQFEMQGLAMSPNQTLVAGTDMMTRMPVIWNTTNNSLVFIRIEEELDGATVWQNGSFYDINDNGLAVGSITSNVDYIDRPVMANANGNGTYTLLYASSDDAGGAAYGVTDDGSVIVGFHYDASWVTYACIWTDNGQTRTDLPSPTAAQMGVEIDFVSARWISADGNTILGYAQDANTGNWIAMAWHKNGNSYEPVCFSNDYYQTYSFDDMGNAILPDNPNPYFVFEPTALSEDGNWVALKLLERYDLSDWEIVPEPKVGRYNLSTGVFEALENATVPTSLEMFGIANDGTCVGRMEGEMDMTTYETPVDGVLWKSGVNNEFVTATDLLAGVNLPIQIVSSSLSSISADATHVMGYVVTAMGQVTFVAQISEGTVGIDEVEANQTVEPRIKGIYDMMGRKLDAVRTPGIYIIDGKKVMVR